jgi:hypothetical protein
MNHYIVQISIANNLYYDPSYGVTYSSPAAFEATAIQGYAQQFVGVDVGGNYHFASAPLPTSPNIIFTPYPKFNQ